MDQELAYEIAEIAKELNFQGKEIDFIRMTNIVLIIIALAAVIAQLIKVFMISNQSHVLKAARESQMQFFGKVETLLENQNRFLVAMENYDRVLQHIQGGLNANSSVLAELRAVAEDHKREMALNKNKNKQRNNINLNTEKPATKEGFQMVFFDHYQKQVDELRNENKELKNIITQFSNQFIPKE